MSRTEQQSGIAKRRKCVLTNYYEHTSNAGLYCPCNTKNSKPLNTAFTPVRDQRAIDCYVMAQAQAHITTPPAKSMADSPLPHTLLLGGSSRPWSSAYFSPSSLPTIRSFIWILHQ